MINDSIKLNFNEIRTLGIEEFSCVDLIDVFQHELGFMVFKFDTHRNLIKATTTGTMFIDCAKPAFEVFLSHGLKIFMIAKVIHSKCGFT